MNIHKDAKSTLTMRALIDSRRMGGKAGPDRHCDWVSAATVRKWLARHAAGGEAGLADRSCRPHRVQARATADAASSATAPARAMGALARAGARVGSICIWPSMTIRAWPIPRFSTTRPASPA